MTEARDIYGNAVGDVLSAAALLRSIAENQVDFVTANTRPQPKYVYRMKEWDVTVTETDMPLLLIPANLYRTSFIITAQFPPTNALTEFSYGYPVTFQDNLGLDHYGITVGPASIFPSVGFNNPTQPTGGTVSIDDIYVTIPGFGLRGAPRTLPFPTLIAAFEETAQPV